MSTYVAPKLNDLIAREEDPEAIDLINKLDFKFIERSVMERLSFLVIQDQSSIFSEDWNYYNSRKFAVSRVEPQADFRFSVINADLFFGNRYDFTLKIPLTITIKETSEDFEITKIRIVMTGKNDEPPIEIIELALDALSEG